MDRTYRRGDLGGQATHVMTLARVFPQDQEAVWAAFSTAKRLSRWFLPVSGDLRVGGRYQFEGNAGGVIEACEPPKRIAATWEMMGGVSWVELTFAPDPGGTRFTLRHTSRAGDLPPGMWDKFGPGAVGVGWELGLYGLGLHLAGQDAERDKAAEASWVASSEGRAMVIASAEGWAAAGTAGGEDAAMMQATIPALIAFYTGTPA